MNKTLYTIGYAGKQIDEFIKLLKIHGITCLIDVRTSPFSKTFSEYDKNRLKETLKANNILYAHFGEEFGARRVEQEAYTLSYNLKGEQFEQVDFSKVENLPSFRKGVDRIFNAVEQGFKICFMCSEKHPIDCHRFWLVAYYFATLSDYFDIINIISENETQTFMDVINEVDLASEKKKFYKEHNELQSVSLIQLDIPKWVQYWDKFFSNNESDVRKKWVYSNNRIGYKKGFDEND